MNEAESKKIEEAAELAKEMIAKAEEAAKQLVMESEERAEQHHKERLEEMAKAVTEAINKSVNGKVEGLRKELQSYIEVDKEWKEEDRAWKARVNPITKVYEDTTLVGKYLSKGTVAVIKFVILVGALFGALTIITNYFFK